MNCVQDVVWYTGQGSITVIQAGGDEGTSECFCHGVGEWRLESGDIFEVKEAGFGDRFDVGLEGEGGITDDTQVVDLGGQEDGADVQAERLDECLDRAGSA